jgi:hypothetical protein
MMTQINIVIDDFTKLCFATLGGGNYSEGARVAAFMIHTQLMNDKKSFYREEYEKRAKAFDAELMRNK